MKSPPASLLQECATARISRRTGMMSKPEIVLLTVTVIGTLVAWPALQGAPFVPPPGTPPGNAPDMACSVRTNAVRDVRPPSGDERLSLDQASWTFRMLRQSAGMP